METLGSCNHADESKQMQHLSRVSLYKTFRSNDLLSVISCPLSRFNFFFHHIFHYHVFHMFHYHMFHMFHYHMFHFDQMTYFQ